MDSPSGSLACPFPSLLLAVERDRRSKRTSNRPKYAMCERDECPRSTRIGRMLLKTEGHDNSRLRYEASLVIACWVCGDCSLGVWRWNEFFFFMHGGPRKFFFTFRTFFSANARYSYWNSRNGPKIATCSFCARCARQTERGEETPAIAEGDAGTRVDSLGASGAALNTLNPMAFEDAVAGKGGDVDVHHETTTAAAGSGDDDTNAKATAGGIGPTATFRCVSCADEMVRSVLRQVVPGVVRCIGMKFEINNHGHRKPSSITAARLSAFGSNRLLVVYPPAVHFKCTGWAWHTEI